MRFISGENMAVMRVELATKLIIRDSTSPPADG
jgi:hypothetical protein